MDFVIMLFSPPSTGPALPGKTLGLARLAHIHAERGDKVLLVQASRRLIDATFGELEPRRRSYPIRAIYFDPHDCSPTVAGRIKRHLWTTPRDEGEVLLVTYTAFLEVDPHVYADWVLLRDELPEWMQTPEPFEV